MVNDQWLLLICSKKKGNVNGWSSAWKTRCFKLFQVRYIRILQQELFTAEKKTWPENTWNMAIFLDDSLPQGWGYPGSEIGLARGLKKLFFFLDCSIVFPFLLALSEVYVYYMSVYFHGVSPSYQLDSSGFFLQTGELTVSMAHKRSSHGPTQTWQRTSPFGWISKLAMVDDTGGYQPIFHSYFHIPFIFHSYFHIPFIFHSYSFIHIPSYHHYVTMSTWYIRMFLTSHENRLMISWAYEQLAFLTYRHPLFL